MLDTRPYTAPCLQAFLTSSCLKKYTTIGFQYVIFYACMLISSAFFISAKQRNVMKKTYSASTCTFLTINGGILQSHAICKNINNFYKTALH